MTRKLSSKQLEIDTGPIGQSNKLKTPKINACIYDQLVFEKLQSLPGESTVSSTSSVRGNGSPQAEAGNKTPYRRQLTIRDLNQRSENTGHAWEDIGIGKDWGRPHLQR